MWSLFCTKVKPSEICYVNFLYSDGHQANVIAYTYTEQSNLVYCRMHEMAHTLYETLLSYSVQAVHVHASINCAACLSEIDLPLNVELVSGE